MIKLNNKGFAISTMLYGLLVVLILLFSLIMSTMSFNRETSKSFVEKETEELESKVRGVRIKNTKLEGNVLSTNVMISSDAARNIDSNCSINLFLGSMSFSVFDINPSLADIKNNPSKASDITISIDKDKLKGMPPYSDGDSVIITISPMCLGNEETLTIDTGYQLNINRSNNTYGFTKRS